MNELTIEVPRSDDDFAGEVRRTFEGEYATRFGGDHPAKWTDRGDHVPVEALVASARPPAATIPARTTGRLEARGAAPNRDPPVRRGRGPVYDGAGLRAGDRMTGPALIDRVDTTIFIPTGHRAEVDAYGNVHIDVRRQA